MGEDSGLSVYRSVYGAHAHLVDLADSAVGHRPGGVQFPDLDDLFVAQCFGSATNVPSGFGSPESCLGSLDDAFSFVLGECAGKIEEHAALCGGAVQLFSQASEAYVVLRELVDELYEVFEVTT